MAGLSQTGSRTRRDDLDLTAGRDIAVRELPMKSGFGFADLVGFIS